MVGSWSMRAVVAARVPSDRFLQVVATMGQTVSGRRLERGVRAPGVHARLTLPGGRRFLYTRRVRRLLLVCALAAGCASLERTFTCTDDASCRSPEGVQGTCEANRACSFPDGKCASGRRYAPLSPDELAGRCVGDEPGDGGAGGDLLPVPTCGLIGQPCCASGAACGDKLTCTGGVCSGCVLAVTAGDAHTCALRSDHTLACWGANGNGQLGNSSTADSLAPTTVLDSGGAPLGDVIEVHAGAAHTCARLGNGTIECWGDGSDGQLGDISTGPMNPTPALVGLSQVTHLTTGSRHTCVSLTDGRAFCWGKNDGGQLGKPPPQGATMPSAVMGAGAAQLDRVIALAGGVSHSCAIRDENSLWCWGTNALGELANGATADSVTPVMSGVLGTTVAAIATGDRFGCAVDASGAVWCFGANDTGQSGQPASPSVAVPTRVPSLAGATAIAAGAQHACARLAGASVTCWGANQRGQRGLPIGDVGFVAAGLTHTCAVRSTGVSCWGADQAGQLGDGMKSDQPAAVPSLLTCP
jgi:alpha-tubulin suppressor-like RCC1 family protein